MSSFKKLIAASAIAVALMCGWSQHSQAAPIIHDLVLTETNPGGGGQFAGTFVIDDSILGAGFENTFIPFNNLSFLSFSISVYGQLFELVDALSPSTEGVFTNSMGMVADFHESTGGTFATFQNPNNNTLAFGVGTDTWVYNNTSLINPCTQGQSECIGDYSITKRPTGVPEPATATILGFGAIAAVWLQRRARRAQSNPINLNTT